MFKFKILSNKTLSRYSINETIYVGENKISWLYFLVGDKIGIYDTNKLNFELQIIFSDNRYMSFNIDFQPKNKTPCEEYEGRLPITQDLTEKAQELKLIVRITDDEENVIGVTNPVSINVEETESPTQEILPRDELDNVILALEAEKKDLQNQLSDTNSKLEVLNNTLKRVIQRDVTEIVIPEGITSIGDYAFYNCTSLTSVTIPNSVTSIGVSAFKYCSNLTNVKIGNRVTSIGDYAFEYCESLIEITIPNSVISTGYEVFRACKNLTSATIGNGLKSIAGHMFFECSNLANVVLKKGITVLGRVMFWQCTSLVEITIPDSVTSIDEYAFEDCTSLESVTIPKSVTNIGKQIFLDCPNLSNVSIETGFNANGLDLSPSDKYTAETIVSWLNSLADRTGLTPYSLIIGETNLAKLTPEQIAIATNKNWNLA